MPETRNLDEQLRQDIRLVGGILGEVIRKQAGIEIFGLEEYMRTLTRFRRSEDDPRSDEVITAVVDDMTLAQKEWIARAFAMYFELINIAEANHRIRVLRTRERESAEAGIPMKESIEAAVQTLKAQGVTPQAMGRLLDHLHIEMVFTAHPTEAKRRTVLSKLHRIGDALFDLETRNLLPRERERQLAQIRAEVNSLWLSEMTRTAKPTVEDEVKTGLYYFDTTLWEIVPDIYRAMQSALAEHYPDLPLPPRFLTFGSWMGGDRDGHPYVTTEVTAETLRLHRGAALSKHQRMAGQLARSLSMSPRLIDVSDAIRDSVERSLHNPDEHVAFLQQRYPNEPYRLQASILAAELEEANHDPMRQRLLGHVFHPGYTIRQAADLLRPLDLIDRSLRDGKAALVADVELADMRYQAHVFGLNAAVLDIRQFSNYHTNVLDEVLAALGIVDGYAQLDNDAQAAVLTHWLQQPVPEQLAQLDLSLFSAETRETLNLLRMLRRVVDLYGVEPLGIYIISMTDSVADVLEVLLLTYWHRLNLRDDGPPTFPIAPLFETRADLENAPNVMRALYAHPVYVRHLDALNREQPIMIGYSDSNKDAGYLAANWELYRAQDTLAQTCSQHDVFLTLFHGRGGTIARGGGPANRAILAQPPGSVAGRLRITEQGEVLYARYSNSDIARRHLHQVVHAVLMSSSPHHLAANRPKDVWTTAMDELATVAHRAYRRFIYETPDTITYWQQATPIREISKMRMGSRPAKRASGGDPFAFLRAIPWVFSWMQSRHVLPGWYGVGTALGQFVADGANGDRLALLQEMYRDWPFFTTVIDNAQMSLSKADMGIARLYATLVEDDGVRERTLNHILTAFDETTHWILQITGQREILDNQPILKRSIRLRNPYVDPLNFIQVALLRELRALPDQDGPEAEVLLQHIFLTVNGVAAGLKNTG